MAEQEPPDAPDYDDADEGPIPRMFRHQAECEAREAARLDRLLAAVMDGTDPIAEGRRAAAKMWGEIMARLAEANRGRQWR